MADNLRRAIARFQFTLDKIPHWFVHHTLSNERLPKAALKLLEPFPGVTHFLRKNIQAVQQGFVKKRILYQRRIHPTMMLNKKVKQAAIDPKLLIVVQSAPPSAQEILQRIEQELH
jgi:hypothetical protein